MSNRALKESTVTTVTKSSSVSDLALGLLSLARCRAFLLILKICILKNGSMGQKVFSFHFTEIWRYLLGNNNDG